MDPKKLSTVFGAVSLAVLLYSAIGSAAQAPARTATDDTPFAVEYYYKARWGFQDEFIRLFRKNHYPLLKKQIAAGRILQVKGERPNYHMTEDARWDYRVTIVWKNAATEHRAYPNAEADQKELYPDQETFKREEQRRFEILQAHWDLPIAPVDLEQ